MQAVVWPRWRLPYRTGRKTTTARRICTNPAAISIFPHVKHAERRPLDNSSGVDVRTQRAPRVLATSRLVYCCRRHTLHGQTTRQTATLVGHKYRNTCLRGRGWILEAEAHRYPPCRTTPPSRGASRSSDPLGPRAPRTHPVLKVVLSSFRVLVSSCFFYRFRLRHVARCVKLSLFFHPFTPLARNHTHIYPYASHISPLIGRYLRLCNSNTSKKESEK